jgi:hypothetical protein
MRKRFKIGGQGSRWTILSKVSPLLKDLLSVSWEDALPGEGKRGAASEETLSP